MINRKALLTALAALALVVPGVVRADSPQFITCSASLSGDDLLVSFHESGLGSGVTIGYTASASSLVQYACIISGTPPSETNRENATGQVSQTGSLTSRNNGKIKGSLTLSPAEPGSSFSSSCTGSSGLVVPVCGAYSSVQVTDDTNRITCSVTGAFEWTSSTFGEFCIRW
jgi:hypothetical protein